MPLVLPMIQGSLTFSFLGCTLDQLMKYYAYIREKKMKAEKFEGTNFDSRVAHTTPTANT